MGYFPSQMPVYERHVFVCTRGEWCPSVDGDGLGVHAALKAAVRAAGSITFLVGTDAVPMELVPGDGFVMPPGVPHAAVVGPAGCTCLEGSR